WCLHAVLPVLAADFGLSGHHVARWAVVLPLFVLVISTLSVALGVIRAAWSVRAAVADFALGPGPRDSVIVSDPDPLVAAAGLTHPHVVVSVGALTTLDDDELAAGLEHEHGHIARRHRYVLVFAALCRGTARLLPATRGA